MNDPEAVKFCNEVVRPMAETFRAFIINNQATLLAWSSGMSAKFSKGAEPVEDGRDTEGVSRLTCDDVNSFIAQLEKFGPGGQGEPDKAIVAKPCVRTLP